MKLKTELVFVISRFEENSEKIKEYATTLKENVEYNNFEKRLVFDCLRAFIGTKNMCEWYDKYNCNDTHIFTLGKAALKELGVI